MSTRVAEEINALMARGELSIVAGRVVDAEPGDSSISVTVRRRGLSTSERIEAGAVVNCTGPDGDFARTREPVIAALRERGALTPDELGLGLLADAHGALIDTEGRPSKVLFTLGSPRRSEEWESTAVPELRAQADRLARRLRESLV
jgi:uncharacterized NAD(P)/FAD-binding protein YdhS